uniref:Uncharacterized protein n=1 Tax=Cacopsylla melanoneura TaxID=428564 RepID=A0A8D8LG66_9HEMI
MSHFIFLGFFFLLHMLYTLLVLSSFPQSQHPSIPLHVSYFCYIILLSFFFISCRVRSIPLFTFPPPLFHVVFTQFLFTFPLLLFLVVFTQFLSSLFHLFTARSHGFHLSSSPVSLFYHTLANRSGYAS